MRRLPVPILAVGLLLAWVGSAVAADVLVVEVAKVTASVPAYRAFGASVAISDDTLLVGAPGDDDLAEGAGAVYVYSRSGDDWIEQAKLTASDASQWGSFGANVAISADTAVISAFGGNDPDLWMGSVYVFVRSGDTWSEQAKLTPADPDQQLSEEEFGRSVAISGDTILVGAPWEGERGSVYVFTQAGATWMIRDRLFASDSAAIPEDGFGSSVAISEDTAVIGAVLADGPSWQSGAAYVFVRSGDEWTEEDKLVASDGGTWQKFGSAVAISDGSILVGAGQARGGSIGSGAAYVFTGHGSSWLEEGKLFAADTDGDDFVGGTVGISGDTAVVGATFSAYVFARNGSVWSDPAELVPSVTVPGTPFGRVAMSDSTIAVGSVGADDGLGAAYLFEVTIPFDASIDIKPGSDTNPVNLKNGGGVIPVALLGSSEFDVTEVDLESLRFGVTGTEAEPTHDLSQPNAMRKHLYDANRDGFTDVVSHYRIGDTGLQPGHTSACLSGETADGDGFHGCDVVRTIPAEPLSPPVSPPAGPGRGRFAAALGSPIGAAATATAAIVFFVGSMVALSRMQHNDEERDLVT